VVGALPADGPVADELVRAEGAMVTVPPDRPRRLPDAIDVLRGAPQALSVMAAGARRYAQACLDPARAVAELEAVAARTMGRGAASSRWGRGR
jgi:hypothetical protein